MPRQPAAARARKKAPKRPQAQVARPKSLRAETSTALMRRIPESLLPAGASARLEADISKAFELAKHSRSPNTHRAYEADREHWKAYAKDRGISMLPIPPEYMAAYILHLHEQQFSMATIRRRCACLGSWHREQGHPSPMKNDAVRDVIGGLARIRKSVPTKKSPLTGLLVGAALESKLKLRDRAVVVVAFATGLRRSELVALTWDDIIEIDGAFAIRITSSKTDKEGEGDYAALKRHSDPASCPVTILKQWREVWLQRRRPKWLNRVFPITGGTVATIVKRAVQISGEDQTRYAGHSARSGMITSAHQDPNVPAAMTQRAARHRRAEQTMDYVRVQNVMANPAFQAAVDAIQRPASKKAPPRRRTC